MLRGMGSDFRKEVFLEERMHHALGFVGGLNQHSWEKFVVSLSSG